MKNSLNLKWGKWKSLAWQWKTFIVLKKGELAIQNQRVMHHAIRYDCIESAAFSLALYDWHTIHSWNSKADKHVKKLIYLSTTSCHNWIRVLIVALQGFKYLTEWLQECVNIFGIRWILFVGEILWNICDQIYHTKWVSWSVHKRRQLLETAPTFLPHS